MNNQLLETYSKIFGRLCGQFFGLFKGEKHHQKWAFLYPTFFQTGKIKAPCSVQIFKFMQSL
jgi:hypothetical protein